MARQTDATTEAPTSDWDHSHAAQEGDIYNHDCGDRFRVTTVSDDGSVGVELVSEEHDVTDSWSEEATRTALMDGLMYRERDGKSHELATY